MSMSRDRRWMYSRRCLPEFENGVIEFLNFAFSKTARGNQIKCPCKRCFNRYWAERHEVYEHLIGHGFVDNYDVWIFHGEDSSYTQSMYVSEDELHQFDDNTEDLLHDTFRGFREASPNVQSGPNDEAKRFYRLVEEGKQELYPGCKNFSKLSFIIRLFMLKTLHGITNVAFNDILKLLKEMVPEANIPATCNAARNIVRDLGLRYKKIVACPNDCMLYWKEHEAAEECPICHTSKWRQFEGESSTGSLNKPRLIPAKVLWHFPLKTRFQRLYMCAETAKHMTWHHDSRPKDGLLRHPADGKYWQSFDSMYPEFANEPRNVRLGLASDGFNPFRTMSIAHSTWPVVLVNYNLPPWMFMKHEYLMLSLLIPGPEGPGNNIDIYMQPLIDELKDLWDTGLETYDKVRNETFLLHASLMWTISDFPGNSMLSGWKTKGKYACPSCNHETDSKYLKYSRKMCYMGHRRFLKVDHPWRRNKRYFNGFVEERLPPKPLIGLDAFEELSEFVNCFGKKQKQKNNSECPWKKRSIFFELPYWKFNDCRHNLDVMHIEKNFCDNVISTLLDIKGKTKDHANGRFDLLDMGIKHDLHPQLSANHKHVFLPKACYSLSSEEKANFCRAIKDAKLPYGFASNLSRCVNSTQNKVSGYKSHDAHIFLHYLLQVAVIRSLPRHVAVPLIRLGSCFRKLYGKVLHQNDLDRLEAEIIQVLCELEKIFLPSFFDIMVHLPIHLVEQIKLGGPVHGRGMYFIERNLCKLKANVRNRSRPEGSIAEGYLIEECMNFCSRYVHNGEEECATPSDQPGNSEQPLFQKVGHPLGGKKSRKGQLFTLDTKLSEQAHRYALFNSESEEVNEYIKEHELSLNSKRGKSKWKRARDHSAEFARWFRDKATTEIMSNQLFWFAKGPCSSAKKYKGYFANGYEFYTKSRDDRCKTQNSGVSLSALTPSYSSAKDRNPVAGQVTYYGAILEILELSYWSQFTLVLFRCEWYQEEKDEYGLTCVNVNKFCSVDDPFVMPSQLHQVFYVPDPTEHGLSYVMSKLPRDIFDSNIEADEENSYSTEPTITVTNSDGQFSNDENIRFSRNDINPTVVDANTILANPNDPPNLDDDNSDNDDTLWDWMEADDEQLNDL